MSPETGTKQLASAAPSHSSFPHPTSSAPSGLQRDGPGSPHPAQPRGAAGAGTRSLSCAGSAPQGSEPRRALAVAPQGCCIPIRGSWSPPVSIAWILFAKYPFPRLVLLQPQEQTAQRDPQMIPSGPDSPRPGARGDLAHRSCTAHGGFFLEPPTSAPRYRDFAAMKCSFRKGNNKRKKQPVPLPRSAPCRTPRQNRVISLPLAP